MILSNTNIDVAEVYLLLCHAMKPRCVKAYPARNGYRETVAIKFRSKADVTAENLVPWRIQRKCGLDFAYRGVVAT